VNLGDASPEPHNLTIEMTPDQGIAPARRVQQIVANNEKEQGRNA
jgi:hypothetical protein